MQSGKAFWTGLLIYSSVVILDAYTSQKIPQKLNQITGIASYIYKGRDHFIKITNETKEVLLTCGLGVQPGAGGCFLIDNMKSIDGKLATANWYTQSPINSNRQNMVVTFEIDGDEIISKAMSEKRIHNSFRVTSTLYTVYNIFIVCMLIRLTIKKSKDGKPCLQKEQQKF